MKRVRGEKINEIDHSTGIANRISARQNPELATATTIA
jgi:hypothetical protein